MGKASCVDCILPFHGRVCADYLVEACESVLSQGKLLRRLYLIQDGQVSGALAGEVARLRKEPNIRLITLPQQFGLPVALNIGILVSSAPYIARMDADDLSRPGRFDAQVEALEREPALGLVGGLATEFSGLKPPRECDEERLFTEWLPLEHREICRVLHYRNPVHHPTVMFRRTALARVGLYRVDRGGVEDLELWTRFAKAGVRMRNIPRSVLWYRVDGVVGRRAQLPFLLREARVRLGYGTYNVWLVLLKLAALGFRLLPVGAQELAYRKIRRRWGRA